MKSNVNRNTMHETNHSSNDYYTLYCSGFARRQWQLPPVKSDKMHERIAVFEK